MLNDKEQNNTEVLRKQYFQHSLLFPIENHNIMLLKKTKRTKKEFSFIAFRVIIYDILPFFQMNIYELENELGLFGYFKKDRMRKIFTVFSSVFFDHRLINFRDNLPFVNKSLINETFCVESKSVKTLRIMIDITMEAVKNDIRNRILQNTDSFIKCESLDLAPFINPYVKIIDLTNFDIIKRGSFPRLKTANFDFGLFNLKNVKVDFKNWIYAKKMWSSLESLCFIFSRDDGHYLPIKRICDNGGLKNLKKLDLILERLPTPITLELPKLEYLCVTCCQNLVNIVSFKSLKKLFISANETLLKNIMDNQNMDLSKVHSFGIAVYWNDYFLKRLDWGRFRNMEYFFAACTVIRNDVFKRNEFVNLMSIRLVNCPNITGLDWNPLLKLKVINFEKCDLVRSKKDLKLEEENCPFPEDCVVNVFQVSQCSTFPQDRN